MGRKGKPQGNKGRGPPPGKRDKEERKERKKERKEKRAAGGGGGRGRDFDSYISNAGLVVLHMRADGNCLFRSFADQICGQPEQHFEYRETAMAHMKKRADHFKWFMEDDETLEQYIRKMSCPGEWGGQIELQALAEIHGVNVLVHSEVGDTFEMTSFSADRPLVQVSYHGSNHYNSVRLLSEKGTKGAPKLTSLAALLGRKVENGGKGGGSLYVPPESFDDVDEGGEGASEGDAASGSEGEGETASGSRDRKGKGGREMDLETQTGTEATREEQEGEGEPTDASHPEMETEEDGHPSASSSSSHDKDPERRGGEGKQRGGDLAADSASASAPRSLSPSVRASSAHQQRENPPAVQPEAEASADASASSSSSSSSATCQPVPAAPSVQSQPVDLSAEGREGGTSSCDAAEGHTGSLEGKEGGEGGGKQEREADGPLDHPNKAEEAAEPTSASSSSSSSADASSSLDLTSTTPPQDVLLSLPETSKEAGGLPSSSPSMPSILPTDPQETLPADPAAATEPADVCENSGPPLAAESVQADAVAAVGAAEGGEQEGSGKGAEGEGHFCLLQQGGGAAMGGGRSTAAGSERGESQVDETHLAAPPSEAVNPPVEKKDDTQNDRTEEGEEAKTGGAGEPAGGQEGGEGDGDGEEEEEEEVEGDEDREGAGGAQAGARPQVKGPKKGKKQRKAELKKLRQEAAARKALGRKQQAALRSVQAEKREKKASSGGEGSSSTAAASVPAAVPAVDSSVVLTGSAAIANRIKMV